MKLKEKITDGIHLMPLIPTPNQGELNNYNLCIDKIEKIADDYAIEFAEWIKTDWACDERWSKITDSKELLEIFKKEKGL